MLNINQFKKISTYTTLAILVTGSLTTQAPKSVASSNNIKVTEELVLSVDISGSVDANEYNLQMDGYAAAFRDQEVIDTIQSLPDGLAVNLQFWASRPANDLGWRVLKTEQEIADFADLLDNMPRPSYSETSVWGSSIGWSTNVSGAIAAATNLITQNQYDGDNLVIDVSGDGTSNSRQITGTGNYWNYSYCTSSGNSSCIQVDNMRDAAVALGITINGLPIDPSSSQYIKAQYEQSVKGGEQAFVELSNGFNDFSRAATTKIKREIITVNENELPNNNGDSFAD